MPAQGVDRVFDYSRRRTGNQRWHRCSQHSSSQGSARGMHREQISAWFQAIPDISITAFPLDEIA